jgi:bifunctional non-homologous end joining protein LigD
MAQTVELTRPEKVLWPDDGLTKRDLFTYYEAVAPALLETLKARPLTVKRYPDGIEGEAFYQKNAPRGTPSWVKTISLHAGSSNRDVDYVVANDRATLLWLGNLASIELHPWLSRIDRLDRPDFLLLDIDPPEGRFDQALRVATLTREALSRHGLEAVAKTSGSKGMHVVVPLVRRHTFEHAQRAAYRLAVETATMEPALVTTEFRKADRGGRVFLDYTRMGRAQHVVAPYSPRARPGGPVSFPVEWDRVEREMVNLLDYSLKTVPAILERDGDRWRKLSPRPQRLPAALTGPGEDVEHIRRR